MEKFDFFEVRPGAHLQLDNLHADVRILPGRTGVITVKVVGEAAQVSEVQTFQNENLVQIWVPRETQDGSGDIYGGDYIDGDCVGGSVVTYGNIENVQGLNISGMTSFPQDNKPKAFDVRIEVPVGTFITSDKVYLLEVKDVQGSLSLSLRGISSARVQGCQGIGLSCRGTSEFSASNVLGGLNLDMRDSAKAHLKGRFGDVSYDGRGSSQLTLEGNAQNVTTTSRDSSKFNQYGECAIYAGEARGSAKVNIYGGATQVSRRITRDSAQINVRIR